MTNTEKMKLHHIEWSYFNIKVYNYYLKLVIDYSLDLNVGYNEGRSNNIKFIN